MPRPSPHPTHRPDWSRCADYYSGGGGADDKWRTVAEGKSSDYLVDVLLAQIAGVDISEIRKDDNFQAMVCVCGGGRGLSSLWSDSE